MLVALETRSDGGALSTVEQDTPPSSPPFTPPPTDGWTSLFHSRPPPGVKQLNGLPIAKHRCVFRCSRGRFAEQFGKHWQTHGAIRSAGSPTHVAPTLSKSSDTTCAGDRRASLSYPRGNTVSEQLAAFLVHEELPPRMDNQLQPGELWEDVVKDRIAQAKALLGCMDDSAAQSTNVGKELAQTASP